MALYIDGFESSSENVVACASEDSVTSELYLLETESSEGVLCAFVRSR